MSLKTFGRYMMISALIFAVFLWVKIWFGTNDLYFKILKTYLVVFIPFLVFSLWRAVEWMSQEDNKDVIRAAFDGGYEEGLEDAKRADEQRGEKNG